MAAAMGGRQARREELMSGLCAAIARVIGPGFSVEAHGGRGIAILRDGGKGGVTVLRAAPWLPALTAHRDLLRTAKGVADAVHTAVTEQWPGVTALGEREPSVTADDSTVTVRFFATNGDPLPPITVSL